MELLKGQNWTTRHMVLASCFDWVGLLYLILIYSTVSVCSKLADYATWFDKNLFNIQEERGHHELL